MSMYTDSKLGAFAFTAKEAKKITEKTQEEYNNNFLLKVVRRVVQQAEDGHNSCPMNIPYYARHNIKELENMGFIVTESSTTDSWYSISWENA